MSSTIRRKKKVKANTVARGTILFSHCQYNGIIIEYRLNQFRKEYYELFVYPKVINASQDYNIGLTIKSKSDILSMEQKSSVYGQVVKHFPTILSQDLSNGKTMLILSNGVRKILQCSNYQTNQEDCTRVGAFKFKFRVQELEDLDLWITLHGNYKDFELIKIPNLTNYLPPLKKFNIYQAYPYFRPKLKKGDKKWWLSPQRHYVQDVPNPEINWHDVYQEINGELESNQILDLIRKIIYKQYQDGKFPENILQSESNDETKSEKQIDCLELGLKNLKLETFNDNHHFRIDNTGPELDIFFQDSHTAQILTVPPETLAFDFLVKGYNICVRLIDQDGPVIFEQNIERLNAEIYCVEQITGFWIYITNNYPYDISTKIRFDCQDITDFFQEDIITKIPAGTKQRKWFNHPFGQLNYNIKIFLLDNNNSPHNHSSSNSNHSSRSTSGNGSSCHDHFESYTLLSQKDIKPKEDTMSKIGYDNATFLGRIKSSQSLENNIPSLSTSTKNKQTDNVHKSYEENNSIKLQLNSYNIDLIQQLNIKNENTNQLCNSDTIDKDSQSSSHSQTSPINHLNYPIQKKDPTLQIPLKDTYQSTENTSETKDINPKKEETSQKTENTPETKDINPKKEETCQKTTDTPQTKNKKTEDKTNIKKFPKNYEKKSPKKNEVNESDSSQPKLKLQLKPKLDLMLNDDPKPKSKTKHQTKKRKSKVNLTPKVNASNKAETKKEDELQINKKIKPNQKSTIKTADDISKLTLSLELK